MKFTSSIVAALAVGMSVASPVSVETRAVVKTPKVNDGIILNYALTLEFLERKFYAGALAKFSQKDFIDAGFPDPFYRNLKQIYFDEKTHVSFLVEALAEAKIVATKELVYKFPYTDVKSFITLASVLEGVGVSAYLGAAASIANPEYLTAAGTILTIEARHSSYIRAALKEVPFPYPFDTPLDFNQVYSLASAFIVGGSSPVTLPFQAFPKLVPAPSSSYIAGKTVVTFVGAFATAKKTFVTITEKTTVYAIFFSGLQKIAVKATVCGNDYKVDKIPSGIAGQIYIMLSLSATVFTDEYYIAGPAILEVTQDIAVY